MGGTYKNDNCIKNVNDKRVVSSNRAFWSAILELAGLHIDEFPFSARTVSKTANIDKSGSILSRGRGGLKQFLCDFREQFVDELYQLVDEESSKSGEISASFCRKLGFLITSYNPLFALDIITCSHRNTEAMAHILKPLIRDNGFLFFGTELYALLSEWQLESFRRELVLMKYERQIQKIMTKYQITRPDMTVTTASHTKGALDE